MTSPDSTTQSTATGAEKLSLPTLAAMVVGSMVGAGVFSLPRRFATETGVAGALIAWAIAGTGMLMLAFVFQTLAIRKPNLDSGVYRLRQGGLRGVPRVLLRVRLLGQRVRRQRHLLGPHLVDRRRARTGPRRRRHLLVTRAVAPSASGCSAG